MPLYDGEQKVDYFCESLCELARRNKKPLIIFSQEDIILDLLIDIKTGPAKEYAEDLSIFYTKERGFDNMQRYYVQYDGDTDKVKFYLKASYFGKN